jgi:hypothetical protein
MYVADTGGALWRSDDAGAHWMAPGTMQPGVVQMGRWIAGQRQWLFCAPSAGSLACSSDGGVTWHTRATDGGANGCTQGAADILADGSLLMACTSATPTAQPGWYALMRRAPGDTAWRPIGTVPSYHFTLTATGQIWGFAVQGAAVYVATLAA